MVYRCAMSLPITRIVVDGEAACSPRPERPAAGRPLRILLVEDDATIGELVAELLALLGHEVCGIATTERGAIAAAGLHTPDLMIVDVYLRAGTGISAMEVIQRQTAAMPHIFMTGGPRHVIPNDAIVLHKPFGAAGLTEALERVVGQVAPERLVPAHAIHR